MRDLREIAEEIPISTIKRRNNNNIHVSDKPLQRFKKIDLKSRLYRTSWL